MTSQTAAILWPEVDDASSGSVGSSGPRTTRVNVMFLRFTAQSYLGYGLSRTAKGTESSACEKQLGGRPKLFVVKDYLHRGIELRARGRTTVAVSFSLLAASSAR